MEILNKLLAPLIDIFKAKNPTVYIFVVALLIGLLASGESLVTSGYMPEKVEKIMEWVAIVLLTLTGARTPGSPGAEKK